MKSKRFRQIFVFFNYQTNNKNSPNSKNITDDNNNSGGGVGITIDELMRPSSIEHENDRPGKIQPRENKRRRHREISAHRSRVSVCWDDLENRV